MPKCVSFSINNLKTFLLVITYWIFEIVFRVSMYLKWDSFKLLEDDAEDEYLFVIFLNISDLFSFFGLIVEYFQQKCSKKEEERIKKSEKQEKEQKKELTNEEIVTYGNITNKDPLKKRLLLAPLFAFDLLARFFNYIFHNLFDTSNEEISHKLANDFFIFLDTSTRFILYIIFFFNHDFGCHKIFSTLFILVILVILIILDIISIDISGEYDLKECLYYILIVFPKSIIFPIVDTIAKKFMVEKNFLPLQYMKNRGAIEFIYMFIITLILCLTSHFHMSLSDFNIHFALIASIYIIANFIKSILLINVIYEYSSEAVAFLIISEPLSGSIYKIINFFKEEKSSSDIIISIIEVILVILICFATMIYEEIIIIEKCGLSKDIKEKITKRAEFDVSLASFKMDLGGSSSTVDMLNN